MRIAKFINQHLAATSVLMACGLLSAAVAQTTDAASSVATQQQTTQTVVRVPQERTPANVASQTEVLCGGFIQYQPSPSRIEIVGSEQEQEQHTYAQGDYVFINVGSQQGIRAGQEFAVIRPRGRFESKFSSKRGTLGVYTQELGLLRVTDVKDQVSVAMITTSCDNILLGDLLVAAGRRFVPTERTEVELDRFKDPNGKQNGRIVLARDGREMVSQNQVVYIDLGAEDQVKPGDYFTIHRPAGTGNLTRLNNREITPNSRRGFESDRYRGGKFSNGAQRIKNADGSGTLERTVTTPEIKQRRPPVPRMIVGELVILNVQQRTATAVITRVAQEVHTGDFVELQ